MTDDLWLALAASFGPVLKEAFPDEHPVTRFQVANALMEEVKKRENWFKS